MLTFDPDKHIYHWNGNPAPSVTQVIGEWINVAFGGVIFKFNRFTGVAVDIETMKAASDYGTAVHDACAILVRGGNLDWDALDPSLTHSVKQFAEYWKRHHFHDKSNYREGRIVAKSYNGEPIFSKQLNVAGTPDIIKIVSPREVHIIEIKTSKEHDTVGPQTAAYAELYKDFYNFHGKVRRFVLCLPKTGKYEYDELKDPNDLAFFKARLFEYRYIRRVK